MKTQIDFIYFDDDKNPERAGAKPWPHYRWEIEINGVSFEYKTGTGHATPHLNKAGHWNKKPDRKTVICTATDSWAHVPEIDDVLECLISDMRAGGETFPDFCGNFGYSEDSRQALEIYLSCQATGAKLRRALGPEFRQEIERIDAKNSA